MKKVTIKLSKPHPRRKMNFGKHKVTQEFQTFEIDEREEKILESDEAKHWFKVQGKLEESKSADSGNDDSGNGDSGNGDSGNGDSGNGDSGNEETENEETENADLFDESKEDPKPKKKNGKPNKKKGKGGRPKKK